MKKFILFQNPKLIIWEENQLKTDITKKLITQEIGTGFGQNFTITKNTMDLYLHS